MRRQVLPSAQGELDHEIIALRDGNFRPVRHSLHEPIVSALSDQRRKEVIAMGGNGKDDNDAKDGGKHDVSRNGQTGKTADDIDPDKYGTDNE